MDGGESEVNLMRFQNQDVDLLCPTNLIPPVEITFLKNGLLFEQRNIGTVRMIDDVIL